MTDAVIVSTARTPLCKSWKGAFNMTHGAELGGHAVKAALERAGIEGGEVEDVLMGCANPEGATGANIARQVALRAGLPVTVAGATVNRFCSSGLQTIAMAAQRVIANEGDVYVAGGVESISCVQQEMNHAHAARHVAGAEQAGRLHVDAGDRRDRGQALQDLARTHGPVRRRQPAEGRRGARGRPVQGRDRADHRHRRRRRSEERHPHEGSHRRERRRHPPGHHLRRHQGPALGAARRPDQRRQREPVQRRRRRLRGRLQPVRRTQGPASRSAASSASPWPAASPTRWASARSSPCPRCSSAWA